MVDNRRKSPGAGGGRGEGGGQFFLKCMYLEPGRFRSPPLQPPRNQTGVRFCFSLFFLFVSIFFLYF